MKKNKKQANEEKIVVALDTLDKSHNKLLKFASNYDEYIDNAAIRGDDVGARRLIKQKIGVYGLAEQLSILKGYIMLGAYTSGVMASLGALPGALAACKGLLSESPDFKNLGNSISKIFSDMRRPAQEISSLNKILDDVLCPPTEGTLESRLDGSSGEENSEQFNTEYAAMMERIKSKVATEAIVKPDATVSATGVIDYPGIVDEENKKK